MRPRNARRLGSGFTLFEVLLSLALTALLVGAVFTFLDTLARRRDELAAMTTRERELGTLLDRIEADLATAVVGGGRDGPGIRGGASELSVLTRRVVAHGGGPDRASPPGELSRVRYVFDGPGGVVRAGRGATVGEVSPTEVVAESVRTVRVRFYDGRAWRPDFDSERENGLPAAIEIALWSGRTTLSGSDLGEVRAEPDRVRTMTIPDGPSSSWGTE